MIENVRIKCIIFGESLRYRGKKNKICVKIIQKVLKRPLQYVKSQQFSRGACSRLPLEPFLFSIGFKIILPEKTTLDNKAKVGAPSLKKIRNTPQT